MRTLRDVPQTLMNRIVNKELQGSYHHSNAAQSETGKLLGEFILPEVELSEFQQANGLAGD